MMIDGVVIRSWCARDSVDALTAMLHRSYAPLAARGLNFTAAEQDADLTRRRIERGECMVAESDETIIGTITLYPPGVLAQFESYRSPDRAVFAQFAVEPSRQCNGIGDRLLHHVEKRAREMGVHELAFDTAEPATDLIAWYARRGYRFVERVQWDGKTYCSIIMSKRLRADDTWTEVI